VFGKVYRMLFPGGVTLPYVAKVIRFTVQGRMKPLQTRKYLVLVLVLWTWWRRFRTGL
jgi:hypothetical protein